MESIRIFREKLGLSQKQLAAQIGVSHQAVCKWENGTSYPRADKLVALASTLGCSISDFFAETQARP